MKRYERYKDSGVEWVGEIPEGWEVRKLKRAFSFATGFTPPTGQSEYYEGGNHIWINISDLKQKIVVESEKKITDKAIGDFQPEIVPKGSLLYSFKLSVGKVAFVSKPVYTNEAIFAVKPAEGLALDFFYYSLPMQIIINANENIYGAKILNQELIKNTDILLPSREDQTAIANYLDRKTAEIDELIAQKERLIELYEEEKTAIINQAVTKGIDPDARLKDSGIDWLGEIPEGWEVKRLRYVGNCQNGVSKGADYFGTGFPFVSYSDVYNNFVLPQNVEGLANSTEIDQVNYSVIKGDLLFTRTSETIEEIGISSTCLETINRAIFSGFLIRFRPFDGILFEGFSKYFFRSKLHRLFFVKEMNLVTRASLSQELLKRLPVILPPFPEQCEIASYLDRATSSIDAKIAKTKRIIELQKEYRTALISEVVTGKIKVTEESTS